MAWMFCAGCVLVIWGSRCYWVSHRGFCQWHELIMGSSLAWIAHKTVGDSSSSLTTVQGLARARMRRGHSCDPSIEVVRSYLAVERAFLDESCDLMKAYTFKVFLTVALLVVLAVVGGMMEQVPDLGSAAALSHQGWIDLGCAFIFVVGGSCFFASLPRSWFWHNGQLSLDAQSWLTALFMPPGFVTSNAVHWVGELDRHARILGHNAEGQRRQLLLEKAMQRSRANMTALKRVHSLLPIWELSCLAVPGAIFVATRFWGLFSFSLTASS